MGEKNAGILNFEITNGVKKTYLIYSCAQSVVKVARCFVFEWKTKQNVSVKIERNTLEIAA